jgi:hypothetical protein
MRIPTNILTPARVCALTVALPIVYVLRVGPERFYYESWGTWIISPVIYTRISPAPFKDWLRLEFVQGPFATIFVYAVPVALLFLAAVLALVSIGRNSLSIAFVSLGLVLTVFVVYHFLQPLGISYETF